MKRQLLFFLGCILLLVALDSCMVGPNFQKSEVKTNTKYRYDSLQLALDDSVLNIKWWEIFNDSALDTLIHIGLRENQDVLIAASRVNQAASIVGFTKADMWPGIGYSAGVLRGNFIQGLPSDQATNIFSGFGTLDWELDFWGKFRRANEAARAELIATDFGYRSVQIGLISQITSTYYLLLDYKWRLKISKATFELRQESLEIIQARYDEGIIPEIDLNQAQIQQAIAASAIPFFERKVAQTENAISVLIGRSPESIEQGDNLEVLELPPDIPVGIPSMILARRPDIIQAQELAHAQTARIGVAQAQRFPAISLTGLLGVASTDLNSLTSNGMAWNIGGSLAGPLFNFNKNKKRVEIERYKAEQAMYQYQKTVLTAFREVEDALVEIHTLKVELQARQNHVNAAVNARELSKERYNKGVTSYLELLESERQAFDAELGLSEITQQLFNGYVKLYKALGGGWITREEELNANSVK